MPEQPAEVDPPAAAHPEPAAEPADSGADGGPGWVSLWARASGNGRIYQAGRDQYIIEAPSGSPRVPPPGSPTAQIVDQVLTGFQPPPVLQGLVARVRRRRWTSVTGVAGSGKTALLTALARPERCLGRVPEEFIHALVYCDATTTVESLALDLCEQLLVSVPGYQDALAGDVDVTDPEDWQGRDGIGRWVRGPLRRLDDDVDDELVVRLVIDGLDQLEGDAAQEIPARLAELAGDQSISGMRVVVSHRDPDHPAVPAAGPAGPAGRGLLALEAPAADLVSRYLQARRIDAGPAALLAGACCRGDGAWLAARLLADVYDGLDAAGRRSVVAELADPADPARRAQGLRQLWQLRLDHIPGWQPPPPAPGQATPPDEPWASWLRPVLTALAAAGAGPVMPITLLAAVSAEFGGPGQPDGARAILDQLGNLVLHTRPGTDGELVGLFHTALVEHLAGPRTGGGRALDLSSGRRVLLQQIEQLAPVTGIYTDNPLYRWASTAEAEHYWQSGMPIAAYMSLFRRPLPTPRQNLDRWTRWHPRFRAAPGPCHRYTLATRAAIAHWTGLTGEPAEALRLYRLLLSDQERVLGPLHGDTLTTRGNTAHWTGQTGEPAEALRLIRLLLPDQERVLGLHHPDTLATRADIAFWTGRTGEPDEALRLYRLLLPAFERSRGPHHPDTLTIRQGVAHWTGETGKPGEALRLHRLLLPDQERVLGPLHPDTLATRENIASWTGDAGEPAEVLHLYRLLLADRESVLGLHHPGTLTTRGNIAYWTRETGEADEALRLYRLLLPDQERALGPLHPDALVTRRWIESLEADGDDDAGSS